MDDNSKLDVLIRAMVRIKSDAATTPSAVCKSYIAIIDSAFEAIGLYPCQECGELRTEAQGGTTFTVCDKCWEETCPTGP